jgi:hypothetical protein
MKPMNRFAAATTGVGIYLVTLSSLILAVYLYTAKRSVPIQKANVLGVSDLQVDASPDLVKTPGTWVFINWTKSMFSTDTPDCIPPIVSEPPTDSAACASSTDTRFECHGGWTVELLGVHPNAGIAESARASFRYRGTAGDGCDLVMHAQAHRVGVTSPFKLPQFKSPLEPAACFVKHAYVDARDLSGCASDTNTCQSETCRGHGVGPCKTLAEWNTHRCPSWYEHETCMGFMGVFITGTYFNNGMSTVSVGGPHANCAETLPDGGAAAGKIKGTSL